MRSQARRDTLRRARRRRLCSRAIGRAGRRLSASLRLQLDSWRHCLLRQEVLNVGRAAATPEEPHQRVGQRRRRDGSVRGRALAAVAVRRIAADPSFVLQNLSDAAFEPARDRALSPLRETLAVVAAVFIVPRFTASAAPPPHRRRSTAVFLAVLSVRGSAARRRVRHAAMSTTIVNLAHDWTRR